MSITKSSTESSSIAFNLERKLTKPSKLIIKSSNFHGYGVFAYEDILANETLEEAPFVMTNYRVKDLLHPEMTRHLLTFPCKCSDCEFRGRKFIFTCGHAIQYNSCKTREDSDIIFKYDRENKIVKTISTRDIKKGKEILVCHSEKWYERHVENKHVDSCHMPS